jgi:hypothetical protein
MTQPSTFVSAVEAVKAWVNGRPGLTGAGGPLPLGARTDWLAPRSPGQGGYALLTYVGGGTADGDGVFMQQARVSANVYAGTLPAAELAARALIEAIEQFQYQPPVTVTVDPDRGGGSVIVQAIDNVTGPTAIPDGYLVDAVFYLSPSP